MKLSASFLDLLCSKNFSIAVTLVPGRLIMLGSDSSGRPTIDEALLDKPWGLALGDGFMAVATRRDVQLFSDSQAMARQYPAMPDAYDKVFAPRVTYATGECEVHDLWVEAGNVYGVNTRFSTVCRFDALHSFTPIWRPAFISELRAEDRCHLNGMAWEGGRLAYASAFGQFDTERGWRVRAPEQGVIIDCATDAILSEGMCLPHSPRVIEGQLYATEMGEGTVVRIDRRTGLREELIRLDGMTRGLAAIDGIAIVGLSRLRKSLTGWTLPLAARNAPCIAGLAAIELASGRLLGTAEFPGEIDEVFDLQVLPGVRRAGVLDMARWNGQYPIDTPEHGFWMQHTNR